MKWCLPQTNVLLWKGLVWRIWTYLRKTYRVTHPQKALLLYIPVLQQAQAVLSPLLMKSQTHSSCSKEFTLCVNKRLTVTKAQGSISHFQLSALIWLISSHIHWILRNRAWIWTRHHQLARWQLPSVRGGPGFHGVSSDHHQTTQQIAAPHSSSNPAGHLNVFLTLLKQIREARGIMMLIWPYYGLRMCFWETQCIIVVGAFHGP